LGAALAVFMITTPFFFIDWHAVSRSLQAETVGTITNDRSGWFENVGYYLGEGIPDAISFVAPLLAVAGMAVACVRRDTRRLLLMGFIAVFLAVISLSSLHWQRWAIQVLPVIVLFAASAVVTFGQFAARQVRASDARRWIVVGLVVAGAVAIAAEPAASLIDYERMQDQPSTRALMRSWIVAHVPVGTPIASEVKGPELRTAGYPVLDRYDLPTDGTLGDYAAHGYHYLIVNAFVSLRYRIDVRQFPRHARFYQFLRERGELLADFRDSDNRTGPHLKLYFMDPAILAVPHRPINVAVTSRSNHDRLSPPKPLYPVGEEIFGDARASAAATTRVTTH
jgi:hypothetical protein